MTKTQQVIQRNLLVVKHISRSCRNHQVQCREAEEKNMILHDVDYQRLQCPIQDFFFWGQRVKGLSANGKKVLMLKNKIIRSQLYFEEDKRKQS